MVFLKGKRNGEHAQGMKEMANNASSFDDPGVVDQDIHVVALINRKSGGQNGKNALKILGTFENTHTLDLLEFAKHDTSIPDNKLKYLLTTHPQSRVVFGGGDGTVAWGFEILERIGMGDTPAAILALGTGNEYSGCVGWGHCAKVVEKNLKRFIDHVRSGEVITSDVWKINYEDKDSEDSDSSGIIKNVAHRPRYMASFMSWGTDADISHRFHLLRENRQKKRKFERQRLKLNYINLGIGEIRRPSPPLNNKLEVFVDNNFVDLSQLPHIRSLSVLNINRMAEQVNFFGKGKSNKHDILKTGEYDEPKLNDGKFEVVGTKSILHMTKMRVGATHAYRLGQGRNFQVEFQEETPMLIDGEAWINPPGKVSVEFGGRRNVVLGPKENKSTRSGILREESVEGDGVIKEEN